MNSRTVMQAIHKQRVGTDVSYGQSLRKKSKRVITLQMIVKAYERGFELGNNSPKTHCYFKDAERSNAFVEGYAAGMKVRMARRKPKAV